MARFRTSSIPFVYRIFNETTQEFIGSSSKSLWSNAAGAKNTLKTLSKEEQKQCSILKYSLALVDIIREDDHVATNS